MKAPGCSDSWWTRMPSSRAIRSSRRCSQDCPGWIGGFWSDRLLVSAVSESRGAADGGCASAGNASPKMTESRVSSMPMRSRMTLRVKRCRKDSLSTAWSVVCVSAAFAAAGLVFGLAASCIPGCTLSTLLLPALTLLILRILRVSRSISSSSALLCSTLHLSILCILSSCSSNSPSPHPSPKSSKPDLVTHHRSESALSKTPKNGSSSLPLPLPPPPAPAPPPPSAHPAQQACRG